MKAVIAEKVPFAKYYVQEIAMDEHYVLNGEKYLVSFEYQGQEMTTVYVDCGQFKNFLKRGTVKGIKVNEDDEPLENALFGLFSADCEEFTADNAIMTSESDSKGEFGFEEVPFGSYIVREIAAPEGYVLSNESYPVTVSENEETINIRTVNEKIRGNVTVTKIDEEFEPEKWRKGVDLPTVQGTVVGCRSSGKKTVALVDEGDVHTLMVGAAGVGKTAFFLYPNIEFACASGMSFINTDCKGDVVRNYGTIAKKYYGYNVSVLDLRNPTRSDENNILHLVNKYMDVYLSDKRNISAKAKAEKYAKITAKTIIDIGGGSESSGANAYFYDAAEGLLASTILLLAEFGDKNERHIVSVFKLIQDLLAKAQPDSKAKAKTYFSELMEKLPP